MKDSEDKLIRQLPRNSIFQVLSFSLHVVIGIFLVPYLIKHLGTAAYGLIPIATMLTQYVSLISQSISSAVNRFFTIALQKRDYPEANRIFSTAFLTYLSIGLVQCPLFILVIYFADTLISIPSGLYTDAIILLLCNAAAFIVNIVAGVFSVPMYAYNRLDYARGLDMGRYLYRVIGIITLFSLFGPKLRYLGYIEITMSLLFLALQVMLFTYMAPMLRIRISDFDWVKTCHMLGMGGWLLINSVGSLLFLRMDVWICNRFVNPQAAGEYAAALQWAHLFRSGGLLIAAVVAPMVIIYYSKSNMDSIIRLCRSAVRILSLLLAIPISLIFVFSDSILSIWLGPSYVKLAPLMQILLCHLVINLGVLPLFSIQVAMNKVKLPALVTLFMGAINLFLAIGFVKYSNMGIYGVALAGAIVLTSKNAIFTPIYASKIMNRPWHSFITPYLPAVTLMVVLTTVGWLSRNFTIKTTFIHLLAYFSIFGFIGVIIVWFIIPKKDRQVIISLIPERMRSIKQLFAI